MATEKHSKLGEIKEIVLGAVAILGQIKDREAQESFGKVMETAKIAKEIIDDLKKPEMVKNIENFRLISENINDMTDKLQNTMQKMEKTGIIDETKELIKCTKNTISLVSNTGQDLRELSVAFREIFRSIRTTQETIHDISKKYRRPDLTQNVITVMPCEVDDYCNLGWQYVGILPNGKAVVRRGDKTVNQT